MNNVDLKLVKSDTKNYTITVTDCDGVAVDISGWSLYFTVKNNYEDLDANAIITKNVVFPSNASSIAGIGYLPLTTTDTDVALGNYKYDMKLIDGVTSRRTFSRGKYNIIPTARLS